MQKKDVSILSRLADTANSLKQATKNGMLIYKKWLFIKNWQIHKYINISGVSGCKRKLPKRDFWQAKKRSTSLFLFFEVFLNGRLQERYLETQKFFNNYTFYFGFVDVKDFLCI